MTIQINTPGDLQAVMGTDYQVSQQQWAAVTAPLRPAVVIAGAGSGKTTLMAARVVYLVATGQVAPEEVLGLTFTTKAAAGLATSVTRALSGAGLLGEGNDEEEPLEPAVSTYNAYAARLLTEHGLRIGFEPDTRVLADATRYQVAARAVSSHTGQIDELSDHRDTVVGNVLALDSAMSEHLVGPGDVIADGESWRPGFLDARNAEAADKHRVSYLEAIDKALGAIKRRAELVGLVEDYRALKRRLGVMDFSEQIELAARLAVEHPEVGAGERARYKVVLLDEYQDTSVAQAILLSRLFGEGHPVMAVGDPNQAIYGWRGASVSNILNFGSDFSHPDGVPAYQLTVSRRSAPVILDLANHLAAPLYADLDGVLPLDPAPGRTGGEVHLAVYETQADELAALADQVGQAHAAMPEPLWREIGVLTRDNRTAARVFDALSLAEIPVEIVGISGLLRLPEVAQVLSVLKLLHDETANADLLTLLSGPRWAIGPRDLALLGKRARLLADASHQPVAGLTVDEELAVSVVGSDPTEVPALAEALADPGPGEYSEEARQRFGLLAAELRSLRGFVGEPLLDLLRRIIDVTGIDVELASAQSPAAAARRDNLDLFVKAVADFEGVDGDISLTALLAWLKAEEEHDDGLDVATPSPSDSVKLLTVHRAKGLEWHSVFVVGVNEGSFPSTRGQPLWVTSPMLLPSHLRGDARDVPHLEGFAKADIDRYREAMKVHHLAEERRLAYVAVTRPAEALWVSAHVWADRPTPYGPSPFLGEIRNFMESAGLALDRWTDKPARGVANPLLAETQVYRWPSTAGADEAARRREAAALVRSFVDDPRSSQSSEDPHVLAQIASWDADLERLIAEAHTAHVSQIEVELPSALSATALAALRDDPIEFARDLARPMPRRPSASARFGTRFHAWIESRFGQLGLIDPDDLPGRADAEIDDDDDLRELIQRFSTGAFADRKPLQIEAPFALVLAGQVVRGRIDAVYADDDNPGGFLLVDWKTNRAPTADPLQLAIYREAWAELHGVPSDLVRAAFYYVRADRLDFPTLPNRADLEHLLTAPST